jgi:hypothetical protein
VQKFSGILNMTVREIQPCAITDTEPTLENGSEDWSFNIGICSFLKAVRLIRLRAAPPSIRTWYSLMFTMVGVTIGGSYATPAMLLG